MLFFLRSGLHDIHIRKLAQTDGSNPDPRHRTARLCQQCGCLNHFLLESAEADTILQPHYGNLIDTEFLNFAERIRSIFRNMTTGMTSIGILSDTHLLSCSNDFLKSVSRAFNNCDTIIHAGDLTDIAILRAFAGKKIYAVHGNMCNPTAQRALPKQQTFIVDGYTIGICHGAGNRYNIEDRMLDLFPEADCIVYGHTHRAVCHTIGTTLLINPGSFQSTGRYGAQGTYALLKITDDGLHGDIYELPLSI